MPDYENTVSAIVLIPIAIAWAFGAVCYYLGKEVGKDELLRNREN